MDRISHPYYIYANSSELLEVGIQKQLDIDIKLQPPIVIKANEHWTCALSECDFGENWNQVLNIYCDIIKPSFVNGKLKNLLRRVQKSCVFDRLYFKEVDNYHIDKIKICLRDENDQVPANLPPKYNLVLVLERV